MIPKGSKRQDVECHPLTPDRFCHLERLFGPRGACGGCWCMWWRLSRSQFAEGKGEGNRLALRRLVEEDEVPGLLAYAQGEPVAWCALGPREAYPALERSRVLKRVDDAAVWSVVCFFVAKPFRRRGLTVRPSSRRPSITSVTTGARSSKGTRWNPRRIGSPTTPHSWAFPPPSAPLASPSSCAARRPGRSCATPSPGVEPSPRRPAQAAVGHREVTLPPGGGCPLDRLALCWWRGRVW